MNIEARAKAFAIIESGTFIQFKAAYARMLKSIAAALVLEAIRFAARPCGQGWFPVTDEWISERTTLSHDTIQRERKRLFEMCLIDCERKGLPASMHYRITDDCTDTLAELIVQSEPDYASCVVRSTHVSINQSTQDALSIHIEKNTDKEDIKREGAGADAPPAPLFNVSPEMRIQPAPPRKRTPKLSPANITEHDDKRVASYLELCRSEITPTNAALITERVSLDHADKWRDVCARWAENGYNSRILANMFDAYDTALNAERVKAMRGKTLPKAQPQRKGKTHRRPQVMYTDADRAAAEERARIKLWGE